MSPSSPAFDRTVAFPAPVPHGPGRIGEPAARHPFETVLITEQLALRPVRAPDHVAENRALGLLARELTSRPETVLRMLAELVTELCRADSAGISILNEDGTAFEWQVLIGPLARDAGGGLPRESSRCGTVINGASVMLLDRPHRCFPALAACEPPAFECLLAPFAVQGAPRGTIWAVAHRPERHFDAEDARLLASLAGFAAAGHQMGCALQEARTARAELERHMAEELQARSALHAAHDHLAEVLESLPEAFYALDQDWRFTYVNPRAEERWSMHRDALLGRTLWEAFPQMLGGRAEPELRRVMRERRPARLETRSIARQRWAEMSIHPAAEGGLSVYLTDIDERKQAEEHQALLAREMDHRARNTLTVVQAALRMTRAESVAGYMSAVEGRVAALARAQGLLALERWRGADLRTLLEGELEPFLARDVLRHVPQVTLDGPPVTVSASLAQPLGMAMHELATNAVKHGALSVASGQVAIVWRLDGPARRMLQLRWAEAGGPPLAAPPLRRGFGSRVLETTVRRQIGGTVALAWESAGLVCTMALPLDGRRNLRA